jgi:hypothetical protein
MFSMDGILETAFPPDEPDSYFHNDPHYASVGGVDEVMA